ncbi:MAG: hypothetical protein LBK99_21080 [Opitutaceae bacterium]|jgi:hypothetical protein|nr:hypothetical protein [Opitutaceae bacterium]
MKNKLLITAFCILHSAFCIGAARAQSGPVTKNPNTNEIRESLVFGSGHTLTIASGGTLTLADGATVNGLATTGSLDGKLDKVAGTDGLRAYVVNIDGSQAMLAIGTSATAPYLVQRTTDGHIILPSAAPTIGAHAVSKAYVDARIPIPAVMVIVIQLNTLPGENWTDFEVKITITNFGTHGAGASLYLFYHSPDPTRQYTSGQVGAVPDVWYVESSASDARLVKKQITTGSGAGPIAYQRANQTTGIVTSVMVAVPVDAVIRPDNPALIVEYLRWTVAEHEKDAAGHGLWRLAEPAWRTVAPAP